MDSEDLMPEALRAMLPELELRWKTPERRLVLRRRRLLLGCLTATVSADLLVVELPEEEADLRGRRERGREERERKRTRGTRETRVLDQHRHLSSC